MTYTEERWEEIKALKVEGKVLQVEGVDYGSNRRSRRSHGWYDGFSQSHVSRSVRPSGRVLTRLQAEALKKLSGSI